MASFNWDSPIVDPFLSLDNSNLIPILQDSYPTSQSNPKSKDPLDFARANGSTTNTISPPYSDSSPSPSSANEDTVNESRPNGDKERDRRASLDDIEIDEPQHTSKSPTAPESRSRRIVAPSRRKSGGERIHDESKLLKRKEQNRAAQRAFRERKEKHVKDLEDRVAQLEAKSDSQSAENENLREMLKRLQAENALLRQQSTLSQQNSYSFSLPSGSGMPSASSSNTFFEPGPSRTRPDSTCSTAAQLNEASQPSFNPTYSTFGSSATSEPLSTLVDTGASLSDIDLDSMALFGGPFTTIATNPMFMSYRDPTESMNAFASFGGWDDMSLVNNTYDQFSGLSTLNPNDISVNQKTTNPTVSPYDAQFQAALAKKHVSQETEPCVIDQLCLDMQRKATCTALH